MSILLIIASILIVVLLAKIHTMKKSISYISNTLKTILEGDTNMLISCPSSDKDIVKFTRDLNRELKILRKLKLEYQNGNYELRKSITNISHDIRTPLTAIRGYLDLMKEENNLNKRYLKIIENKISEMEVLTEELFDYTFCIDRYKECDVENICVNEVLEESIVSFYAAFKRIGIKPIVDTTFERVTRKLNRNVLFRIFENIISNSLKYSEGDFKISLFPDGTITFSNRTSKIDRMVLANIFDRFYTVENARNKSGIGLSIAKQLVEMSGGEIDASVKKGELVIRIKF